MARRMKTEKRSKVIDFAAATAAIAPARVKKARLYATVRLGVMELLEHPYDKPHTCDRAICRARRERIVRIAGTMCGWRKASDEFALIGGLLRLAEKALPDDAADYYSRQIETAAARFYQEVAHLWDRASEGVLI